MKCPCLRTCPPTRRRPETDRLPFLVAYDNLWTIIRLIVLNEFDSLGGRNGKILSKTKLFPWSLPYRRGDEGSLFSGLRRCFMAFLGALVFQLVLAQPLFAQTITHDLSFSVVNVNADGPAELLGQVALTRSASGGAVQTTQASTLYFQYQGVPISNLFTGTRKHQPNHRCFCGSRRDYGHRDRWIHQCGGHGTGNQHWIRKLNQWFIDHFSSRRTEYLPR